MASSDVDRLRDDQWERLRHLVPGGREGHRGPRCDNRLFVDALLWMARSSARWRDLPERFSDHYVVKRRYYRWIARGALGGFLAVLTAEANLDWLMIDSTIVRAHQHAAVRALQMGGLMPRDWDQSRGGLSTKVHAATDALGNPVRLLFGPGQRHDATGSHELIVGLRPEAVIADKGYDADHLH